MKLHRFSLSCLSVFVIVAICSQKAGSVVSPKIDYKIKVTLDTEKKVLYGEEKITYVSGADVSLDELYLLLQPNSYRGRESTYGQEAEKKVHDYSLAYSGKEDLGYIRIDSLSINGKPHKLKIDDTIMKIDLLEPLMPNQVATIEVNFLVKIPEYKFHGGRGLAMLGAEDWYPQIAVYDQKGWHPDQVHLLGHYYSDFADYNVSITLPQEFYVGSTGYLVEAINGNNNIPPFPKEQERKTTENKQEEKVADKSPTKTLVFHADKVVDFAWVASPDYVKEETEWNGIRVTALVFKKDTKEWKDFLNYSLEALKYFSERIGPYPCPNLIVAEAYIGMPDAGMAFPNLCMIDQGETPFAGKRSRKLEHLATHEVSHSWFGLAMANDGTKNSWLHEGFATYFTTKYTEWKYPNGKPSDYPVWSPLKVDLTSKYQDEWEYLLDATSGEDRPVTMSAEMFDDFFKYSSMVYSKGSWTLDMLNYVLGDSVFFEVIKSYYVQYKFKHPTTEDFQKVAEEVSGQKLDWFFQQWLYTTKQCDYAVGRISKEKTKDKDYITNVEIKREGEIIMPVEVEATLENGEKKIEKIFADDKAETLVFNTRSPVRKIRIDPNHRLLEINRLNNQSGFLPPVKFSISLPCLLNSVPETDSYLLTLSPTLAYNDVDKLKLGSKLAGSYLFQHDHFSLGASYGTNSKVFNYDLSYNTPLRIVKRCGIGLNLSKDNGEKEVGAKVAIGNRSIPSSILEELGLEFHYPIFVSSLEFSYNDKYDSRYFDEKWYSMGKTSVVSLNSSFINKSYHGLTRLNLDLSRGLGILDADYAFNRVFASASQEFRLIRTGELIGYVRASAGYENDNPPNQEKLDVALGVPKSTVDPIGSLINTGGGGVRGYRDRAILGKELFALNFELRSEILKDFFVSPSLFFDLGRVGDDKASDYTDQFLYDTGIEFKFLDMLYLSLPLYLNKPETEEKKFDFRALIGITFEL